MLPTRHARVLNLVLRFEPAVLNLVPLSREVPIMSDGTAVWPYSIDTCTAL